MIIVQEKLQQQPKNVTPNVQSTLLMPPNLLQHQPQQTSQPASKKIEDSTKNVGQNSENTLISKNDSVNQMHAKSVASDSGSASHEANTRKRPIEESESQDSKKVKIEKDAEAPKVRKRYSFPFFSQTCSKKHTLESKIPGRLRRRLINNKLIVHVIFISIHYLI